MSFRVEEVKTYKTTVICDDCRKETVIAETTSPLGFDNRMNGAIRNYYTFKNYGDGTFKNYCKDCKAKYS